MSATRLKARLKFACAQFPSLYRLLLRQRAHPNLDQLLFLTLLRPGDIVFDIGANRGNYTTLFSHLVRQSGTVHVFEPVPSTFATLQQGLRAEQVFPNVVLNNVALGDRPGQTTLYLPDSDDGQASLQRHQQHGSWSAVQAIQSFSCEMTTLDRYCRDRALSRLDFLKCDVEGAELLVLQGATAAIARYQPLLYLEIFSGWTAAFNYQPVDLIDQLLNLGYTQFYLAAAQAVRRLSDPRAYFARAPELSTNLLCAREGDRDRLHALRPLLAT